jgi:hypothetical protein
MATGEFDEPKPIPVLKRWQVYVYSGPVALLVLYFAAFVILKPDYISLLWSDRMGVQMLIAAAVLFALGSAVFLGGCAVLNRAVGVSWASATLTQVALAIACVALFFFPAIFVVTVGPAAIQIQKNLLKEPPARERAP